MRASTGVGAACAAALVLCGSLGGAVRADEPAGPLYFRGPEEGTKKVSALLKAEDFATLARYYDLRGSGIERPALTSGAFFVRRRPPKWAEPGEPWKFHHPFSKPARYLKHEPSDLDGVFGIYAEVTFGPESGVEPKRVVYRFYMRQTHDGWQVLPVHGHRLHDAEAARFGYPPVMHPNGSPFAAGKEPDRTHRVKVFWTAKKGRSTRIDVVAAGTRPTQARVLVSFHGQSRTLRAWIAPSCEHRLLLAAKAPKRLDKGVTFLGVTGEGVFTVDVFGFDPADRARPPTVTVRYLDGDQVVGETSVVAEPAR